MPNKNDSMIQVLLKAIKHGNKNKLAFAHSESRELPSWTEVLGVVRLLYVSIVWNTCSWSMEKLTAMSWQMIGKRGPAQADVRGGASTQWL
jgi:hypothetical protein